MSAPERHLLYLCTDRGIPVGGGKGASIHIREFLHALESTPYRATLLAAKADRHGVEAFSCPVHIMPDDFATDFFDRAGSLGHDNAATREVKEFCRNQAALDMLRAIHDKTPFGVIYERYSLFGVTGHLAARRLGLPHVLEVNAPLVQEAARFRSLELLPLARAVERVVFGGADHVVAVSEAVQAYVREVAPEARVTVVPNGVDMDRFTADHDPAELPAVRRTDHEFVIGFVGAIRPWHGVELLIEAFSWLADRLPHAVLCIVGKGGELQDQLMERCRRKGLEQRVRFLGAVPHEKIPAVLRQMDVVTAPYPRLANFYFSPLKLFEYMAAGKPIVASAIGQIPSILRDDAGLLVPPGDIEELRLALLRLHDDAALRTRLGETARKVAAREHTWARRMRVITDILDRVRKHRQGTDRIGHASAV